MRLEAAWQLRRWAAPAAAAAIFTVGAPAATVAAAPAVGSDALPWFFDYDCVLVGDDAAGRAPAADWNAVHRWAETALFRSQQPQHPVLSREWEPLIQKKSAEQVEAECPLGALFLHVLKFYEPAVTPGGRDGAPVSASSSVWHGQRVQELLLRFPVYAIALSRWPVFDALERFSAAHLPREEHFCDIEGGLLDWPQLRQQSLQWATAFFEQTASMDELTGMDTELGVKLRTILHTTASQDLAQAECGFGFFFMVLHQLMSAASRETQNVPSFSIALDVMLSEVSFTQLAASGWPLLKMLAIFSDLNKKRRYYSGDQKYIRGFSDWDLRREELAPLGASGLSFLSPAWREEATRSVEEFRRVPRNHFAKAAAARRHDYERLHGALRPVPRGLMEAGLAAVAALPDVAENTGVDSAFARLAYVVLLYGEAWARLLPRFVHRLHAQLRVPHPLVVIAIGQDAAAACLRLSAESRQQRNDWRQPTQQVICWMPETSSQVHRFTGIHGLLHLGIDVIYIDMDVFMLRDPTPRILEQAEGLDAVFASHAGGDCINIGTFFLRARSTAVWLSQFLAWYHDYPFEIDQRGLHIFAGFNASTLQIAFAPPDVVKIRAGMLEDTNEFVTAYHGWHGEVLKLLTFHWSQQPLQQKEREIHEAYDAADAVEAHGVPLHLALGTIRSSATSGDSPWLKVLHLRAALEVARRSEPPPRGSCW